MNNTLQVPENISLRWEAWRGVGGPELLKSAIVTGVALVISIVLAQSGCISLFIAVAIVIVTFSLCVSVLSKLDNNQSIVDYISLALKFKKEQQLFVYKNSADMGVVFNGEEE